MFEGVHYIPYNNQTLVSLPNGQIRVNWPKVDTDDWFVVQTTDGKLGAAEWSWPLRPLCTVKQRQAMTPWRRRVYWMDRLAAIDLRRRMKKYSMQNMMDRRRNRGR